MDEARRCQLKDHNCSHKAGDSRAGSSAKVIFRLLGRRFPKGLDAGKGGRLFICVVG
jgi:hypothetical protein